MCPHALCAASGHTEFLGTADGVGPLSLSVNIVQNDTSAVFSLILRTSDLFERHSVELPLRRGTCLGKPKPPPLHTAMTHLGLNHLYRYLVKCADPALPPAILKSDKRQLNVNFKFGLVHVRRGQRTEEEFFANGATLAKSGIMRSSLSYI